MRIASIVAGDSVPIEEIVEVPMKFVRRSAWAGKIGMGE
jgi:hypothetical protein